MTFAASSARIRHNFEPLETMMKISKIILQQTDYYDNFYIVDRLVNRLEPKVGSVLPKVEVDRLLQLRLVTVTINRARG